MSSVMDNLARSTGIVATLLVVAALVWGLFFSARATGTKLRPAWWLDLHNWLGGLAMAFTAVHILASWLDSGSGIGLAQVFVPGADSAARWPIGSGVIAAYLLAVAVFTTWPRRLARRRLWRALHLGSVLGTALAMVHAYLSGSDSSRLLFKVGLIASAGIATYAVGLRLFDAVARLRHARSG